MANQNTFNNFNLNTDGYAAFDALSLRNLIITRLNSNNIFTDQNFEGSNISSIIDIIAYSYHVLLFYLNQTSSESSFTGAELYENINKIVKLLNYKPIGNQTSILSFEATASTQLQPDTYTIQRYSYFTLNGTNYSFNQDVSFTKSLTSNEFLEDFSAQNLLYQGIYTEYPTYIATGEPFEVVTLVALDNTQKAINIDHFNIDVYVKGSATTGDTMWIKWTPAESLFLERGTAEKYEIRLNENGMYEIKFGNNINGKSLNANDQVAIYYLKSNGSSGQVGANVLNGSTLFSYNTNRFNEIKIDTTPVNLQVLTQAQAALIAFTNINPSTNYVEAESVAKIKQNAPNTFKSQYRLITAEDFKNYLDANFSNILGSVKVVNNWDYLSQHIKYYFDIGIEKPNLESRILFNQVKFADSCNFNNIYVYAVPRLEKTTSLTTRANYLNSAQKQLIANSLNSTKIVTAEVVINDPVYIQIDLGLQAPGEILDPEISNTTYLQITRTVTSKRNPEAIKKEISEIFKKYFSTSSDNLGLLLSLTTLTNSIKSIEGVSNIKTIRIIDNTTTLEVPGVSLLAYNPVYPYKDINIIAQDTQLPYFKFPYLNNPLDFINKIKVITPSLQYLEREY